MYVMIHSYLGAINTMGGERDEKCEMVCQNLKHLEGIYDAISALLFCCIFLSSPTVFFE